MALKIALINDIHIERVNKSEVMQSLKYLSSLGPKIK